MILRRILLSVCIISFSTLLSAQYRFEHEITSEIGLNLGASSFLGDLGGTKGIGRGFVKDFQVGQVSPLFGAYYRYNGSPYWSVQANFNYTILRGSDNSIGNTPMYSDEWFRWYRNMNFKSSVQELTVMLDLMPLHVYVGRGNNHLALYGAAGIGGFHFNPKAYYNGQWIALRPLSTEGQGFAEYPNSKPYSLWQLNFPVGGGIKYVIDDRWSIGLELIQRFTLTDYIDDVSGSYIDPSVFSNHFDGQTAALAAALSRRSPEIDPTGVNGFVTVPGEQRGDFKDNDSYFSLQLKFGYVFTGDGFGGGRRYGCPAFH